MVVAVLQHLHSLRIRSRRRAWLSLPPLHGSATAMRLIGILCWFDEHPSWLAGVVAGLHKAEIQHLIAVDGAYGLYPNGRAFSSPEQHNVIMEVCRALEMGCTLHAPQEPFMGNEVEKRSLAFRLAETVAAPYEDWYFLADADHFVTSAIGHTRLLEETDCDAATVKFCEPYGAIRSAGPLRCVYRAIPGLRYEGNHYSSMTPDGRNLHLMTEPAIDLPIEVEHRTMERDRYRKELQQSYYERRDRVGAETHDEPVAA